MAVFKSAMAREPNIRTLCSPPASHGHCWPLPPPQRQLQTLLPSLWVQNLTEMFCRNQDKQTAGQLFSPPYCPATSYKAQKTRKIPVFPSLSFCWPPAALQAAPRWRQGFVHPLEAPWSSPSHWSSWQRKALGAQCSSPVGRELRTSFSSSGLSLDSSAQYVPQGPLPAEHLLCLP